MSLAHSQRVCRLYRNSLKHLLSWTIDRDVFNHEARLLQARFREGAAERDPRVVANLLKSAEAEFESRKHPDPYIFPTNPGGSKYQRNTPPPFTDEKHFVEWE
eukprot:TRINITY_DN1906_c0_g1_i1.p2 TRINITY_DN1906_c0_g1~~TRINITY_DN1906_c0_g1_i1.p2  ORF type:complete len:113 (-),score=30.57 TRINITY_DN1906_c0_g1_i1:288-596(-)